VLKAERIEEPLLQDGEHPVNCCVAASLNHWSDILSKADKNENLFCIQSRVLWRSEDIEWSETLCNQRNSIKKGGNTPTAGLRDKIEGDLEK